MADLSNTTRSQEAGAFDPLDWLTRMAAIGYRYTVMENEAGHVEGVHTMFPSNDGEGGSPPNDLDLWKELGATKEMRDERDAEVQKVLLSTAFADLARYVDGKAVIIRGTHGVSS